MIHVIGSGPAGVSCASALLEKGFEVTLVDGGVDLEPGRREMVDRLGGLEPSQWRPADLRRIRGLEPADGGGIPEKLSYGSDYPYREADRQVLVRSGEVCAIPTLAKGGFSGVWGAVVAPYRTQELSDWPSRARSLSRHYESVLRLVDLSAADDDLAGELPLFSEHYGNLKPSRQAEAFLQHCRTHRTSLQKAGITVGRSRLAVRAAARDGESGCVYCGLCLHGCPYGLIFNAQDTVAVLRQNPRFHYRPGIVVDRLIEQDGGVTVAGSWRTDGSSVQFRATRVFLACGVFATTRILLATLGAYRQPLGVMDSQYSLLPFLRYRGTAAVETEELHTLAQAFMEIADPTISRYSIHVEVFTYNELLKREAESRLGVMAPLLGWALPPVLRRLLICQCFLHSEDSGSLSVSLDPGEDGHGDRLAVEGMPNPAARVVIRGVWRKLLAERTGLGGIPVPPLLQIAPPGRSFHSGGSFPMRDEPQRFESDVWGRPESLQRIHAVDATVFPSLPATTITLSVMANAHRIAAGCGEQY